VAATSLVVLAGVFLALAGSTIGGWLAVASLAVGLAANVALSVVKYRRTMRRPWPQVAPLTDDDWA
jgi:hypothetical protein